MRVVYNGLFLEFHWEINLAHKSEFSIEGLREYNQSSAVRWIISHCWEHKAFFITGLLGFASGYIAFSAARVLFGRGAALIIEGGDPRSIIAISLAVLIVSVWDGIGSLIGSMSMVILSTRVERDTRHELYASLLGKSQTFHDQQRVGDIMARATDDVRQLHFVIHPGIMFMFDMVLGFAVPIIYIAAINLELLLGATALCLVLRRNRAPLHAPPPTCHDEPAHAIWCSQRPPRRDNQRHRNCQGSGTGD